MKGIIRSISWQDPSERTQSTVNASTVTKERLTSLSIPERDTLEFCTEFYTQNSESPAFRVMFDYFEQANRPEVVSFLEEVVSAPWYEGASFKTLYETAIEEQAADSLTKVCKEAVKIATVGVLDHGVLVKGTDAAVAHLFTAARVAPRDNKDRVPNNMKDATGHLSDLYSTRKNNPSQTYGVMLGYGIFDSSTGGIRKKQLYLHAGYGGHLKSTSMLNFIVNAAVDGGWNPLLFTSEMPQEEVMFLMTAIHSGNPKFNGYQPPLNAFRLLLGNLSPQEELFMKEVMDDLVNNPNHGSIRVVDSGEFTTFGSVMQRTVREHADMEVDVVWCDYITRLPVDAKYRSMTLTEGRNETIAEAKRFAMSFDKGAGLAVCSPFQVNREGYKSAKANEGKMGKTALGMYNAAEKEADVITYIFFDEEEKATSEPKVGIMKSRWGEESFQTTSLFLEPDSRRLFDLSAGMSGSMPVAEADEVEI